MICKTTNVLYIMAFHGSQENAVGFATTFLAACHRVHRQQINNTYLRQIGAAGPFVVNLIIESTM
jgi:hypothetical protein